MRGAKAVAVLAVACSPRARDTRGPPAIDIDVSADASAPKVVEVVGAAAPPACVVRTPKTSLDVKIHAGSEEFSIRVVAHPTIAELDRGPDVLIRTADPIELEGTATPRFVTGRKIVIGDGVLALAAGVEVVEPARIAGQSAVAASVRPGDIGIGGVTLPCDALALKERVVTNVAQEPPPPDRRVRIVAPPVAVCASSKRDAACVELRDEATVERVAEEGDLTEVRATFADGSAIHGFVRSAHVRPTKDFDPGIRGMGYGCGCGRSIGYATAGAYYGKARFRPGAKIYATSDGRAPWAVVRRELVGDVFMGQDDDYARVRVLPGIGTQLGCDCTGLTDHAWVARGAIVPVR